MERRQAYKARSGADTGPRRLEAILGSGLLTPVDRDGASPTAPPEIPARDLSSGVPGPPGSWLGRLRWRIGLGAALVVLGFTVSMFAVVGLQNAGQQVKVSSVDAASAEPVSAGGASPVPSAEPPSVPAGEAVATARTDETAGTVLIVHVSGAVARPGIVRLPAKARVFEAIDAAGGSLPGAQLAGVNLAAVVEDGQQIHLPVPGEAPAGPDPPPGPAAAGQAANGGAKINLNKATVEELATLPRVGPVLAKRIFDWRAQHGKFRSPNDLDAIEGIGPKLLEALLPLVAV